MPSQDAVDPTVEEADRRAERAKASLLERIELLKHKISDAKHTLDLPSQIARHPLPAVGVAFALGIAAGFGRKSTPAPTDANGARPRSLRDVVFAAAATFGLRLVRDAAIGQLGELARQWWTQRTGMTATATAADTATGRRADLEPFLEH